VTSLRRASASSVRTLNNKPQRCSSTSRHLAHSLIKVIYNEALPRYMSLLSRMSLCCSPYWARLRSSASGLNQSHFGIHFWMSTKMQVVQKVKCRFRSRASPRLSGFKRIFTGKSSGYVKSGTPGLCARTNMFCSFHPPASLSGAGWQRLQ